MAYWAFGHRLPSFVATPLFGNRRRYGLSPRHDDPDWQELDRRMLEIYHLTQTGFLGTFVNRAGYRVMKAINLSGSTVLEIGPGHLNHVRYWRGQPAHYIAVDRHQELLETAANALKKLRVSYETLPIKDDSDWKLRLNNESVDLMISFYSLEHLHPLDTYLDEAMRVLRPGGVLVGAIPAEGGLAWGLGRFLTTRRWFKNHTRIDLDKIICWEHPNFADFILGQLVSRFADAHLSFWPFGVPLIDISLVISFVCRKPSPQEDSPKQINMAKAR